MERFITKKLLSWKNRTNRKPLILRGARQVGKTWSVIDFGKRYFDGVVHVVDLEQHPDWHRIFEGDLVAGRMLSELEIVLNARIRPGKDLLFIDEIQSCPRALMALRYFYQDMPELHVIAAESLLEFAMRDISFPVGRVHIINMHPMTFAEFLLAAGKTLAAEIILSPPQKQPESVHKMLLDELRQYMFVGGMPESVKVYVETGRISEALIVQSDLINAFCQDFSKYSIQMDRRCLHAVLTATARNIGSRIKYAHLAEGYSNPTIKKAFELLSLAQLIHKVPAASPAGLPLGAYVRERKFKALLVDIGLMQHLCGMPIDVEYTKADLLSIYHGAMAEQFVGQELVAAGQGDLYYWSREAKSSSAEVDFLIAKNNQIIPVEVKSGSTGRLKSLHLLLGSYPDVPYGVVVSGAHYSPLPEQKLIFIPLYYAYSMALTTELKR